MTAATVAGHADPRFAAVRDAFAANLADGGELGAALCVAVGGRVVVDVWGGWADEARTVAWGPDTLVNAFSVGKALLAVLAADAVGRGELAYDAPVARWWPAFAAAGKQEVTIRQLLAHQAGLPAVEERLPPDAMLDWALMTDRLAAQRPWWQPGTAHGYHVNTHGFLVGEVLRRASGPPVDRLLRERLAGPLAADVRWGVPAREDDRVATLRWDLEPPPEREPAGLSHERLMRHNAYFNPSGLSGAGVVNTRPWREAVVPSTNLHASARGVARVYAALAAGGALDGVRLVDGRVLAEAVVEQAAGVDRVLRRPTRFGLGFQLTQPERPMGPGAGAYGHFGAGGSLGFCDPDAGVAFGYVRNRMDPGWQNPCNRALIGALGDVLG